MNMKRNKIGYCVLILMLVIIVILCFSKFSQHLIDIKKDMRIAEDKALEKANKDTNSECDVVMSKFCGDYFQVGCVNKEGNHAILYMVKPSVDKEFWLVSKLSSRIGANAIEMFQTPVYITK